MPGSRHRNISVRRKHLEKKKKRKKKERIMKKSRNARRIDVCAIHCSEKRWRHSLENSTRRYFCRFKSQLPDSNLFRVANWRQLRRDRPSFFRFCLPAIVVCRIFLRPGFEFSTIFVDVIRIVVRCARRGNVTYRVYPGDTIDPTWKKEIKFFSFLTR